MRIQIPSPRTHPLGVAFAAVPIVVPVIAIPTLSRFFEQTHTPGPIGLAFLGMLAFLFGVLPAITVINGILRSRRGHTAIHVSHDGVTVRERAAWRSHTVATLAAGDIFDVDYGTRESSAVSARLAVEQKLLHAGHAAGSVSPRMERWMAAAARWTKGRGVIVKSRGGLTSFGQHLADDEIRYLHAVVRRALIGR